MLKICKFWFWIFGNLCWGEKKEREKGGIKFGILYFLGVIWNNLDDVYINYIKKNIFVFLENNIYFRRIIYKLILERVRIKLMKLKFV